MCLPLFWMAKNEKIPRKNQLILHNVDYRRITGVHFFPPPKFICWLCCHPCFARNASQKHFFNIHFMLLLLLSLPHQLNLSLQCFHLLCCHNKLIFMYTNTHFYCNHGTNVQAQTFWYFPFDLSEKNNSFFVTFKTQSKSIAYNAITHKKWEKMSEIQIPL